MLTVNMAIFLHAYVIMLISMKDFFWEIVMIIYGNLTCLENKNSTNKFMKLTSRLLTNGWFYEFQILRFNFVRI